MSESLLLEIANLDATMAFGHELAGVLFPGSVVALIGPLGAGKTQLVRAVAEGLGVADSRIVTSPTFVLIQEYEGRLPIYHFDAYRISAAEFSELGAHEYFEGGGVCLVEWADRVAAGLPEEYLRIRIAVTGETTRRFALEALGSRYAALVRQLMPRASVDQAPRGSAPLI